MIDWEKALSPAMRLLQARPQVSIHSGNRVVARIDWLWQGRHLIDAKLGQQVDFNQLAHFVSFAAQRGGSVTYVTLTRTPPSVIEKAVRTGEAQQVSVNFISLLPL